MGRRQAKRAALRKKPTLAFAGDLGTGTAAANANTEVRPLLVDGKKDPNNRGRRQRIEQIDTLAYLELRQIQALKEIRDAWCQAESLSSGGELREQVDTSSRPDQAIAAQVDAQARLSRAMQGVPKNCRPIVEWVCFHNRSVKSFGLPHQTAKHMLMAASTRAANVLRY